MDNGLLKNKVVQSNELIHTQQKFTRNHGLLFRMAVSELDPVKSSRKVKIAKQDIFDLFGITGEDKYTRFKKEVYSLQDNGKLIWNNGNDIVRSVIFTNIIWHRKEDSVTFVFNEYLMPHLMNLKEQFTQYPLEIVSNFKSQYSTRIYELIRSKMYHTQDHRNLNCLKEWSYKLEELKHKLDCDDKYNDFRNFEKFVLTPAFKEINLYSDIVISYEKVKRGKSIKAIKFYFRFFDRKEEFIKSKGQKKYLEWCDDYAKLRVKTKEELAESGYKKLDSITVEPTPEAEGKQEVFKYNWLNDKH